MLSATIKAQALQVRDAAGCSKTAVLSHEVFLRLLPFLEASFSILLMRMWRPNGLFHAGFFKLLCSRTSSSCSPVQALSSDDDAAAHGISMQLQELLGGELAGVNAKRQDMEEGFKACLLLFKHVTRFLLTAAEPRDG